MADGRTFSGYSVYLLICFDLNAPLRFSAGDFLLSNFEFQTFVKPEREPLRDRNEKPENSKFEFSNFCKFLNSKRQLRAGFWN